MYTEHLPLDLGMAGEIMCRIEFEYTPPYPGCDDPRCPRPADDEEFVIYSVVTHFHGVDITKLFDLGDLAYYVLNKLRERKD